MTCHRGQIWEYFEEEMVTQKVNDKDVEVNLARCKDCGKQYNCEYYNLKASGVQVSDECKTVFQEVKMGHKYRYIIFNLTPDMRMIQVMKKAEPEADYKDFLADLMEAEQQLECRYAVYDVEYTTKDNQLRNKLVFYMWSPEKAKIKQKMVYASSRDALKKALGEGIAKEVQANDHGDLKFESVMEIITRTERV